MYPLTLSLQFAPHFLFVRNAGLQQFQPIFEVENATQKIRGLNRDKA